MARAERRTKELTGVSINQNGAGTQVLAAAVAAQTTRVHRLFLTASATTATVQFARGATNLTGVITLAAGVPLVLEYSEEPHFDTAANEAFNLIVGGAGQVSGQCEFIRSA